MSRGLRLAAAAALCGWLGCAGRPAAPPAGGVSGAGPAPGAPASIPAPATPLRLDREEAVLLALEGNHLLRVQRLAPRVARAGLAEERAAFHPAAGASLQGGGARQETVALPGLGALMPGESNDVQAAAELRQRLPGGGSAALAATESRTWPSFFTPEYLARLGLEWTQPLLRDRGRAVNLAGVRRAELEVEISLEEARGLTMAVAAAAEEAWWQVLLADRLSAIREESLGLAERWLADRERRLAAGQIAPVERAAAAAEVARRQAELIDARSAREQARLALLRLVSPPGRTLADAAALVLVEGELPALEVPSGAAEHVRRALADRPELREARLRRRQGELEVVRTRNGLLPRLDFFVALGLRGYGDDASGAAGEVGGEFRDWRAGLTFSWPLGNAAARARHERAQATLAQADEALLNLEQLVEVEVRSSLLELARAGQQVEASGRRLALEEEKLRVEEGQFEAGRSTALSLDQARRDLTEARLGLATAEVAERVAILRLWRADGSLAERRRLAVEP